MSDSQIPAEYGMPDTPSDGGGRELTSHEATDTGAGAPVFEHVPTSPDICADGVVTRPLADLMDVAGDAAVIGVVIELAIAHPEGIAGAGDAERALITAAAPAATVRVSTNL